jgi:hypothetical protein
MARAGAYKVVLDRSKGAPVYSENGEAIFSGGCWHRLDEEGRLLAPARERNGSLKFKSFHFEK